MANLVNHLLELLSSVPDVIWSGAIGAGVALLGVFASNAGNTKRLLLQMDHDSSEKSKERIAELRKEVFIEAVAELSRVPAIFMGLVQLDPTKGNIAEGFQNFAAEAAKLQLVAEPKTGLMMNQLVADYGELHTKLIVAAMPIYQVRSRINLSDDLYKKAESNTQLMSDEISKYRQISQPNEEVLSILQNSLQFHQRQVEKFGSDRSVAYEEFNTLNIAFVRGALYEFQKMVPSQIAVVVEIRRDLGLTSNLDEVVEQMKRNWDRMVPQVEASLSAFASE
jgi:hypothetical protein